MFILKSSIKRKYERILAYIENKSIYYYNSYMICDSNDNDVNYYLAMSTAYKDVLRYLKNNLK